MFKPLGTGISSDPEAILMENGESILAIYPDGKYKFKNKQEDFINLVSEFMQEVADIITNTQIGPQPPINKANFLKLKDRLETLIKK